MGFHPNGTGGTPMKAEHNSPGQFYEDNAAPSSFETGLWPFSSFETPPLAAPQDEAGRQPHKNQRPARRRHPTARLGKSAAWISIFSVAIFSQPPSKGYSKW
jgi:hypothetical protein